MTRTILITGGTGFVGAALVRRLLADGHDVHLLVRAEHASWRLIGIEDEVMLHVCDLADAGAVDQLISSVRPDAVLHLAVYGAYSSQQGLELMLRTNLHGTIALVDAARRHGCEVFVNTGSSSEYGLKDHPPLETEALEPNSDYALTKAAATMYCRMSAGMSDMRVPTLRLYSIYGPWEEPTRLVPTLVVQASRGAWPPLVDPSIARDFVYVDDAVDAYVRLLDAPLVDDRAAVFNVASGEQTTLRELVDIAREAFDVDIDVEPAWGTMESRAWDTDCWVGEPSRIAATLGWRATTPLVDGLRSMAEWIADSEPSVRERFEPRVATGT